MRQHGITVYNTGLPTHIAGEMRAVVILCVTYVLLNLTSAQAPFGKLVPDGISPDDYNYNDDDADTEHVTDYDSDEDEEYTPGAAQGGAMTITKYDVRDPRPIMLEEEMEDEDGSEVRQEIKLIPAQRKPSGSGENQIRRRAMGARSGSAVGGRGGRRPMMRGPGGRPMMRRPMYGPRGRLLRRPLRPGTPLLRRRYPGIRRPIRQGMEGMRRRPMAGQGRLQRPMAQAPLQRQNQIQRPLSQNHEGERQDTAQRTAAPTGERQDRRPMAPIAADRRYSRPAATRDVYSQGGYTHDHQSASILTQLAELTAEQQLADALLAVDPTLAQPPSPAPAPAPLRYNPPQPAPQQTVAAPPMYSGYTRSVPQHPQPPQSRQQQYQQSADTFFEQLSALPETEQMAIATYMTGEQYPVYPASQQVAYTQPNQLPQQPSYYPQPPAPAPYHQQPPSAPAATQAAYSQQSYSQPSYSQQSYSQPQAQVVQAQPAAAPAYSTYPNPGYHSNMVLTQFLN